MQSTLGVRSNASAEASTESLQHLRQRLLLLDELLRMAVTRARKAGFTQDEFQGLYVDDEEVDGHLNSGPGTGLWTVSNEEFNNADWRTSYRAARQQLENQERSAPAQHPFRFLQLIRAFDLSPAECELLLIGLAPELDRRYERLYSFLQDDVTRRRPSVDLALNLVADSLEERVEAWRLLSAGSALIDFDLIGLFPDPAQREPTLLSHFIKTDGRLTNFMLGHDQIDPRIRYSVHRLDPDGSLDDLILDANRRTRLRASTAMNPIYFFYGTYGAGTREAAAAMAGEASRPLIVADMARLKAQSTEPGQTLERLMPLVFRESRLAGGGLLLENWITILDDRHAAPHWLMEAIIAHPLPVFLSGSEAWEPHAIDRERPILRVEFASPEYEERLAYWRRFLGDAGQEANPAEVSNKFKLTGGQIRDAVRTARDIAAWRGEAEPTTADLYAGARAQSNRKLSNLAQKIDPRYSWEHIVLPDDNIQQLREIANQVEYAQQVYGDWGFRGRAKDSRGITALFAGDSGTGKTMSADVIGHELGLDLYRIDLSTVVSKYIGETEKNLSAIFDEASQSNAILFFDEANSLFGKRSEVKDSHDRYANIETGYLLQRMETYNGVAILATNRLQDLDKAFIRRLDIVITFPSAEKSDRARIWQVTFPQNAPLANDVDFVDLARRHKLLAGGNIRNVVTTAAFVAAAEGEHEIALRHIEHAIKREYQKMSKLVESE